jgi:hypothetical protein
MTEKKELLKIMCKGCRRFFWKADAYYSGDFDFLQDKENNPHRLCYVCYDKFIRQDSINELEEKYGKKNSMNLSQHHNPNHWHGNGDYS